MKNFKVLYTTYLFRSLKTKSFIISNAIIVTVILALCIIPSIIISQGDNSFFNDEINMALYSKDNEKLMFFGDEYETIEDSTITTFNETYDKETITDEVIEEYTHIIDIDNNIVYSGFTTLSDSDLEDLHNETAMKYALGDEYDIITDSNYVPVEITTLDIEDMLPSQISNPENSLYTGIGIVFAFFAFLLIITLTSIVSSNISKEKISNTIEIILPNTTPKAHFLATMLYSFTIVFISFAIYIIAGIIGSSIASFILYDSFNALDMVESIADSDTGSINELTEIINFDFTKIIIAIALSAVFFITSLIINSSIIAIISSYIKDMESAAKLVQPIIFIQIFGFYVAIFTFMTDYGTITSTILAIIPIFSALGIPTAIATSDYPVIVAIAAAATNILALVFIYKKGISMYREGLLGYNQNSKFSYKEIVNKLRKNK